MKTTFILCVEANHLEQQALLLVRSIRRFAGTHRDDQIHAYRPRPGPALAQVTSVELERLGVDLHEEPLNRAHAFYPFANKIYACAAAEAAQDADVLVFCDSDTVFLGEPDFSLAEGEDALVTPVGVVGKGSTGPGHRNEEYWQRLYALTGVSAEPFVTTSRTRVRSRGYWNAGLVVSRRAAGIFGDWLRLFGLLMETGHLPASGGVNSMDQIALAAALSLRPGRLRELDYRYNYSIPRRAFFSGAKRSADLSELVHVHYHRWFNRPGFLDLLEPPIRTDTPQYEWLQSQLPLTPTIAEPLHGQESEAGAQLPADARRRARRRLRRRFGTERPQFDPPE